LAQWDATSKPASGEQTVPISSDHSSLNTPSGKSVAEIENWLISNLSAELGLSPAEIDVHDPFVNFGMDSLKAIRLAADLGIWLDQELSPTLAYDHPNIRSLAQYISVGHANSSTASASVSDKSGPIAIIGIGCRFPEASGPEAFWQLLKNGVDAVSDTPIGRRAFEGVDTDQVNCYGGFLKNIDEFDADFFGISSREAIHMDPQQRLMMEVCWETLEDAGLSLEKIRGSRTGVYIGISSSEYGQLLLSDPAYSDPFVGPGNALSISANRLSYWLGLRGPSMAVDTACSSSLVAAHLACKSLQSGECDSALVGGVNIILSSSITNNFRVAGFIASDGRCKAFDDRADGYVRGEGAGIIMIKPLAKAQTDGDHIYALIRGGAVNQDGRTNGLTAPSGQAQKEVLIQAYSQAGVEPSQVQYVEAHGTGTKLGDPIEAQALGEVVGAGRGEGEFCVIGSVKSNICLLYTSPSPRD